MIAPRVAVIVVPVTLIGTSAMSNVVVLNMSSIVVANISINKMFFQFDFEARER